MSPLVGKQLGGSTVVGDTLNAIPAAVSGERGDGLRVRLAPITGETPWEALPIPLYLPAALGDVGWTENFLHTDFDTVKAGQFSQPGNGTSSARELRILDDLATLVVAWDPVWMVERGQDPDFVHDSMFAIGRSRKPVELLMTPKLNGPPLLRMNITIRSIRVQMRSGEADTLYYNLTIEEWRRADLKRKGSGSAGNIKLPTTHELTATDTLHSLSMKFYKTATYARDIAAANGIKSFGVGTALVKLGRYKVGSKIKIPDIKLGASL